MRLKFVLAGVVVVVLGFAIGGSFLHQNGTPVSGGDLVKHSSQTTPASSSTHSIADTHPALESSQTQGESERFDPGQVGQPTAPEALSFLGPPKPLNRLASSSFDGDAMAQARTESFQGLVTINEALSDMAILVKGNEAGPPVVSNAEITRKLMGDNLDETPFLAVAPSRLNDSGELLDEWGKPYYFHPIRSDYYEIRSAGPDQQMWSKDDVLFPSEPYKTRAPRLERDVD